MLHNCQDGNPCTEGTIEKRAEQEIALSLAPKRKPYCMMASSIKAVNAIKSIACTYLQNHFLYTVQLILDLHSLERAVDNNIDMEEHAEELHIKH